MKKAILILFSLALFGCDEKPDARRIVGVIQECKISYDGWNGTTYAIRGDGFEISVSRPAFKGQILYEIQGGEGKYYRIEWPDERKDN